VKYAIEIVNDFQNHCTFPAKSRILGRNSSGFLKKSKFVSNTLDKIIVIDYNSDNDENIPVEFFSIK